MYKFFSTLLLLMISVTLYAQPNITRSIYFKEKQCLGYKNYIVKAVQHSGGSVFGLMPFDYPPPSSDVDTKLYKLNNQLDTVWTKKYGGSNKDDAEFIYELPNGHLLICGTTNSKDGDVFYGHAYSAQEIWLMEVDTMGTIIKGRTFGGSNGSGLWNVMVSSDGKIYMCGTTLANDYDFTHVNFGTFDSDAWIAKLDTAFNLIWVKAFTGNSYEAATAIEEVSSNRLIIGITTEATNAEMAGTQAKGRDDLLAMYIDSSGNEIWKKRYGGKGADGAGKICVDTFSKTIFFVGPSRSGEGDITYHTSTWSNFPNDSFNYNRDCWILKMDTLGTILGSKVYGVIYSPYGDLFITDAILYQGNIWVIAYSPGGDGDMAPDNDGPYDNGWIAMIDTSQTKLIGAYTITGINDDYLRDFFIYNNSLAIGGFSYSYNFSCDTISDFGFILNVGDAPLGINEIDKGNNADIFTLYPNPSDKAVHIKLNEKYKSEKYVLHIYTAEGQNIMSQKGNAETVSLDCSMWVTGTYFVTIELGSGIKETVSFNKL